MDSSASALAHGIDSTRTTLARWNRQPEPILRAWVGGSLLAAGGLLAAVWVIGTIRLGPGPVQLARPPFQVGGVADAVRILVRNGLVLALHAMACVAGFIAGSSLPLQASAQRHRALRAVHEQGGRVAIAFVVSATAFSLSVQALTLGGAVGRVGYALHTTPFLLLLALLPHALPELMSLFLPLAAWIIASRQHRWDELLAATAVTVGLAIPVLAVCSLWEVYVAPHLLQAIVG